MIANTTCRKVAPIITAPVFQMYSVSPAAMPLSMRSALRLGRTSWNTVWMVWKIRTRKSSPRYRSRYFRNSASMFTGTHRPVACVIPWGSLLDDVIGIRSTSASRRCLARRSGAMSCAVRARVDAHGARRCRYDADPVTAPGVGATEKLLPAAAPVVGELAPVDGHLPVAHGGAGVSGGAPAG